MFKNRDHGRRWGAIGPLTAIMLIPMTALVAFAVDLGNVWKTEAELQNAADSAALAGAGALIAYNGDYLSTSDATAQLTARQGGIAAAKAMAVSYGEYHHGGFKLLDVNESDVLVGYIADPTDPSSPFVEDNGTDSTKPFPNAVQVRTRRDSSVSTGSLPLYFAGMTGTGTVNPSATATASTKVTPAAGFKGDNTGILPVVMKYEVYDWLQKKNDGLNPQIPRDPDTNKQLLKDAGDTFTVQNPLTDENAPAPPYNVTNGPDDTFEASIYNYKANNGKDDYDTDLNSGNWGLIDLANGVNGAPGNEQISNWITNGPTASDLETWDPVTNNRGFYANPDEPLSIQVQTGFQTSIENEFQAIIGQSRVMPVYQAVTGSGGQTAGYQVVGFVGITVVEVNLKGNTARSFIKVQLSTVMVSSPDEVLGSTSTSSWNNVYYSDISLSR